MSRKRNFPSLASAGVAVVVITAVVGGACASSLEPRLVSLPGDGVRPATRIESIFDDRVAVATVAGILQRDLGVPPFPVTFAIYPHERAFEEALLDTGYNAALARSTSKTMVGVGGHRRVLLNGRGLERMSVPQRVQLLAHELGHSLQYELGGGHRGTSDQWLREGFADWFAIRTLEKLRVTTLATVRAQRTREVAAVAQHRVPPLSDLVTFPQWVHAGEQHGSVTYLYSFLAVDMLIERHGVQRLLDYFSRFAAAQDRAGNFQSSFGEPLESFEVTLQTRLWGERRHDWNDQ